MAESILPLTNVVTVAKNELEVDSVFDILGAAASVSKIFASCASSVLQMTSFCNKCRITNSMTL